MKEMKMKTHELAEQLEMLAKILYQLPNKELNQAINGLDTLFTNRLESRKENKKQNAISVPEGIEKKLSKMSPSDIEKYLGSENENFSTMQLMLIASHLGIKTSKRQSKNALVNLIARNFEAGQMNMLFRSTHSKNE